MTGKDGTFAFPVKGALRCAALLLFALIMVTVPAPSPSSAQVVVGVSVTFAPPALPVYVQPLPPGPNYIWIPGYWAWDPDFGYFWVPGTWVLAPYPGWLWTPGYWAWDDGVYVFYEGYWGPVVGFYGGIDYGCGYNGYGYYGGYWRGNRFYYNRAVNNIGPSITTVYRSPVPRATSSRVSFNGGTGGIRLRPTANQLAAERRRASGPVAVQRNHIQAARRDPVLRAAANHGRPAIAATRRPGALSGPGVVRAKRAGAPYHAPSAGPGGARGKAAIPAERARHERAAPGAARGVREQAPRQVEPRHERAVPREVRPPAEHRPEQRAPRFEQRAPREFAPAPEQRRAAPAVREMRPPAARAPAGPAREVPRMAPPAGGGRMEPREAPAEGGFRGGRPQEEGGPHGR